MKRFPRFALSGACLAVILVMALVFQGAAVWATEPMGDLEIRVTDHQPGIADFARLDVVIAGLALHRKGESRRKGWVEIASARPAIDIVPLKNGRWEPLAQASAPVGDYDAIRVRFAQAQGQLLEGPDPEVRTDDAVVRLPLRVGPRDNAPIVVDLYAENLTDHEPQHYVVRVKEVRFAAASPAQRSAESPALEEID